ncbi:uncharacterized protein N7473_006726 [Penicillium subrubescens]|jgi:hypothetical protein|uniref:uncharacterized protein n=1 Tax=Penicillium subrubescens TaxID=1316194 RepID=UPI002545496F|nr:uncharacterized protein N7473_006726 [Penicillium subrubescens]KAJ5890498.1 hypothetical protein N7473_006726 [Penicillium subrubescens]
MELPPLKSKLWQQAKAYIKLPEDGSQTAVEVPEDWADRSEPWLLLKRKAECAVRFKHPEPGTSFLYDDWMKG